MLKKHIKEVVIVEGKTDTTKLKSLFNLDTIETNGSHLSKKNIQLIKNISEQRGVILFLDPDGPGEKIRRILEQNLTKFKQAFIKKNKINPKKIGIAESDNKDIIYALSKVSTFDKNNLSFTWEEYSSLKIDTKLKRKAICDYYNISLCNNKQLFKRLNMMNIKLSELKKLILVK